MKQKTTNIEILRPGSFKRIPTDSDPCPKILARPKQKKANPPVIYRRLIKTLSDTKKSYDIYLIPHETEKNVMFMSVRKIESKTNTKLGRQQLGDFKKVLEDKFGIKVYKGTTEKYYGTIKVEVTEETLAELENAKYNAKYKDKYTELDGYTLDKGVRKRTTTKRKLESQSSSDESESKRTKQSTDSESVSSESSRFEESKLIVENTHKIVDSVISTWLSMLIEI
jgi:hypothetical protein